MKRHDLFRSRAVQPQNHHVIARRPALVRPRPELAVRLQPREAIKCFQKALGHDGECAMAHWGISYASGPNYNLPWVRYDPLGRQMALSASYDAMQAALAHAGKASPVEQAMIKALAARYPQREAIEDMSPWDKAYTRGNAQDLCCIPRRSRGSGGLCRVDHERDAVADVGPAIRQACRGSGYRGMQGAAGIRTRPDSRGVGSPGTAASLCPPDGDVALPAARAAGRRPAARDRPGFRSPHPHADASRRAVRALQGRPRL